MESIPDGGEEYQTNIKDTEGQKLPSPVKEEPELEERDDDGCLFDPPLYRQRYYKVASILREEKITSVVDLGCAECKTMGYYKGVETLEEVIGVDLDRATLVSGQYTVKPLLGDYLCKRSRPLRYRLFQGDLLKHDHRLSGFEAVVMIEVIEHLHACDLEALPEALFNHLVPKLVVLTTPNAEYNVVFPDFKGFRHDDHKFEWTRKEFQDWCDQVADRYRYSVEYGGVGDPPQQHPDVGFCSQLAIFRRSSATPPETPPQSPSDPEGCAVDAEPYELIIEQRVPHKEVIENREAQIALEAQYYIRLMARSMAERQRQGSDEEEEEEEEAVTEEELTLKTDGCTTGSMLKADGSHDGSLTGDGGTAAATVSRDDGTEAGEDADGEWSDDQDVVEVPLSDIVACRALAKLSCTVAELREVLQRHGYTLSTDKSSVRHCCEEEPNILSSYQNDDEDATPANTWGEAASLNVEGGHCTLDGAHDEAAEDWSDDELECSRGNKSLNSVATETGSWGTESTGGNGNEVFEGKVREDDKDWSEDENGEPGRMTGPYGYGPVNTIVEQQFDDADTCEECDAPSVTSSHEGEIDAVLRSVPFSAGNATNSSLSTGVSFRHSSVTSCSTRTSPTDKLANSVLESEEILRNLNINHSQKSHGKPPSVASLAEGSNGDCGAHFSSAHVPPRRKAYSGFPIDVEWTEEYSREQQDHEFNPSASHQPVNWSLTVLGRKMGCSVPMAAAASSCQTLEDGQFSDTDDE